MAHIEIVAYDPRWAEMFLRERQRLAMALKEIAERVEHNGSTSVPGLDAKPVIDIQIAVRDLQPMDLYRAPLLQLGYTHVPHPDDAFCPFFHRPKEWPHTYHVHVVKLGGEEETRTLAFRDYLRDHPRAAEEYAALKRSLAAKFAAGDFDSQQRYAEAKTSFIEDTIRQARSMGYPRDG